MEQKKNEKNMKMTKSISNNKSSITRNTHTPIRAQKSNKIYLNNSNNQPLFPSNNNFNINNNISININIDMSNNKNKSLNLKNKSQSKKKQVINLKKDTKVKENNINNNINNNLLYNALKNFTNKSNIKNSPFHIRIKSENFGINDFKYKSQPNARNKVYQNRLNDYNNKSNFNIFSHKFETKNINDEDNNINKDNTVSLPTEYIYKEKEKKIVKKNNNIKNISKINNINEEKNKNKNTRKKNYFSPLIKNKKNITPNNLNHSIDSRKIKNKNNINDILKKEIKNKEKINYKKYVNNRNMSSSPFNNKNKAMNNTIDFAVNKNNYQNIKYNNIFKSPINQRPKTIKNFNNKINSTTKNFRSPIINNKNLSKFNKINNITKTKQKNIINKEKKIIQKESVKNTINNNIIKKNNKNNNKMEKNANQEKKEINEKNEKQEISESNHINNDLEQNEINNEKDILQEKIDNKQNEEKEIKKENNEIIEPKEEINLNKKAETEIKKIETRTESEIQAESLINDIFSKSLLPFSSPSVTSTPAPVPTPSPVPTEKKLLKIESICKKGYAGPGIKKTNQDNFFIYKNFINNPDTIFVGVCDGHGTFGHDISNYLVNNLPENLHSSLIKDNITSINSDEDYSKIKDIISLTFVQTNINLVNTEQVDSSYSGSTCSSLIFSPKKIISANLGDSRCVLAKFDGEKWTAQNITRDHKPTEEDEKKRIIEKGGRIEAYKDEEGQPVGPERVWLKGEDLPGLAMSRSFGDDVAHMIGVTSKPEILEYKVCNEDKFILLGSDGIFEFISSQEAVDMVKDFYLKDDIDGALNHLYKISSQRWLVEEEVIDDITLIIMFLK